MTSMSGPSANFAKDWGMIRQTIKADEPHAATKCLGCEHPTRLGCCYQMLRMLLPNAKDAVTKAPEPDAVTKCLGCCYQMLRIADGRQLRPSAID